VTAIDIAVILIVIAGCVLAVGIVLWGW